MGRPFQFSSRRLVVAMLVVALLAGIRLSMSWHKRQGETNDKASDWGTADEGVGIQPDTSFGQPKAADVPADESRRAIEVAREYIKQQSRTPIDATYTAKRTSDGYRVFVEYISGQGGQRQPQQIVGGHCVLEISEDWQVSSVTLGR